VAIGREAPYAALVPDARSAVFRRNFGTNGVFRPGLVANGEKEGRIPRQSRLGVVLWDDKFVTDLRDGLGDVVQDEKRRSIEICRAAVLSPLFGLVRQGGVSLGQPSPIAATRGSHGRASSKMRA